MFENLYKKIDLHGEYSGSAEVMIKEFITDSYNYGDKTVRIIHGISGGTLKNLTHKILKNDKRVESFKLEMGNPGATIVKLKQKNK